jgi:uncharacterized protein (DUF169 family)
MRTKDWSNLSAALSDALALNVAPIAITFTHTTPPGVEPFDAPVPEPLPDGRTGRVAAGCVFWMRGATRTFSTVAEDHGNCSVGSLTHGFKTLEEISGNSDVAALLDSGWVTIDAVPEIPAVRERPSAVLYGPLHETPVDPDVVLLRVTGKQLMVLHDAIPNLRIEGKPQCHIIAIAKEQGEPAASVGCALSRVRTGMSAHEMTCALPASSLPDVVATIQRNAGADTAVARYAAADAQRFSG